MSHWPTAQFGHGTGSGQRTMQATRSPSATPAPAGACRTRPSDSWPRMRRSLAGGGAFVVASVLAPVLKDIAGRPRPPDAVALVDPGGYAMPSAHALRAAA